jgi:hypothetical protein
VKEEINKPFPGQENGIIQILFKNSVIEDSVQLRMDLQFEDQKSHLDSNNP